MWRLEWLPFLCCKINKHQIHNLFSSCWKLFQQHKFIFSLGTYVLYMQKVKLEAERSIYWVLRLLHVSINISQETCLHDCSKSTFSIFPSDLYKYLFNLFCLWATKVQNIWFDHLVIWSLLQMMIRGLVLRMP